jgi:hypothetical protein
MSTMHGIKVVTPDDPGVDRPAPRCAFEGEARGLFWLGMLCGAITTGWIFLLVVTISTGFARVVS